MPQVTVGAGLLGIPYVIGAGYATLRSTSPPGMDRRWLYAPVVGPFLALRGVGCDDSGSSDCDTGGAFFATWMVLIFDGVTQVTGATLLTLGLANHEKVRESRQEVWLVPGAAGADHWGASVVGSF